MQANKTDRPDNDSNPQWLRPNTIPKSPKEVEAKYDKFSTDYDRAVAEHGYQAPTKGAAEFAKLVSPESNVLDAGCGTGLVGLELSHLGFNKIVGMDISSNILAKAQEKSVYSELVKGNLLERLPFEDDSFDAIIAIGVFSRFDSQQIIDLLDEFSRLTKENGAIFFSHREDLLDSCDLLDQLDLHPKFAVELVTDAFPYLPNAEGYENIGVRYVALKNKKVV